MKINRQLLAYLLMALVVILTLFPVFWVASISFKGQQEWFARPIHWLPSSPTLSNYAGVFANPSAVKAIYNSLIVTFSATVIAMLTGFPAAYAISRYRTARFSLFILPLIVRASPPIVFAIPLLVFYATVGLVDTLQALIPIYVATTVFYFIWLVKPFIDAVPHEIEEAAMVDGVKRWRLPFSVVLPIVLGGVAAATIFVFILNWTEFVLALSLTILNARTIPIQMTTLTSLYSLQGYGQQSVVSTISVIPFLFVAYFLQKQLVRTFYLGSAKG